MPRRTHKANTRRNAAGSGSILKYLEDELHYGWMKKKANDEKWAKQLANKSFDRNGN